MDAELALARILDRVVEDQATGCWIYQGATNGHGYCQVQVANVRRLAHQWTYEALIGPISEGMQLDHLCRTHPCCNPGHLEPVTNQVNSQRGYTATANRTRCLSGRHELSQVGTREDYDGTVRCKACREESRARWYARHKAA